MRCEHCGRTLREGDIIHGIKYGALTFAGFKAAQDSAVVVVCHSCGDRICSLIYSSLEPNKLTYPAVFKMVTDLTSLMKNGYKLIQNIAKLPKADQLALQHLISACNEPK